MRKTASTTNQAVAYIRVSTLEQAQHGVSLEAQRTRIASYCGMADLELVAVLVDDVTASKPLSTRPGGQELERLLAAGQAHHVIGCKLDRLFRDAGDALTQTKAWEHAGVALHLVDLGGTAVDLSSPMGRFMLCMLAGCAELERNLIGERTSQALQHLKNQGVKLGQKPLTGPAVARAQELRAQGLTLRQIATILTAEGHATKRGGAWAPSNVALILERT